LSDLLERLRDLYGGGQDQAASEFRLTERGIWHPTPLAVLAAAVPLLAETELVKPRDHALQILDAGAGDGRLVAALVLGLPEALEVRPLGIESDAALAARARQTLEKIAALHPRGTSRPALIVEGDFFDPQAYAPLGLAPHDLDVVFNYPDGNERRLLQWLSAHGGAQTRLAILSPDHDLALGSPPEWRVSVRVGGGASANWTLAVFAPSPFGR
jgi:hypothetical protein